MTAIGLASPNQASELFARLFSQSETCSVSVSEETAFAESDFLALGDIKLFPATADAEDVSKALKAGAFEWRTIEAEAAASELRRLLGINGLTGDARDRGIDKLNAFVDSLGGIAYRLGLAHPHFDPGMLLKMPFRRPTTIVSDTSGVIQGALSFVARYLHPAARIKIPAIVQMEIVNFSDRFLTNRRATKSRPLDLLVDHVKSQSSQRVLIQLELHSDVELERTFLLGDPLRAAFHRDEEKELKELNLSVALRAYADRLILEAARQHQSQVSPGHPVMLLTGDQGLARMAIAEGMTPLYFRAAKASAFFGRRLTGVNFHPFTGTVCNVGVAALLWELATAFGAAKITTSDGKHGVLVRAIGQDLAWAPYHSQDDLLWIEAFGNKAGGPAIPTVVDEALEVTKKVAIVRKRATAPKKAKANSLSTDVTAHTDAKDLPLYKFSVDGMFTLVDRLDTEQRMSLPDVLQAVGVKTEAAISDYRRFLVSGDAAEVGADYWMSTAVTQRIAASLRNVDAEGLKEVLGAFPAYAGLEQRLGYQPVGEAIDSDTFGRASSTFLALAEITGLGATIFAEGFFPTPNKPTDEEFASIAIATFDRLNEGSGWVSTGLWLEELIRSSGIHPLVARSLLQSASERRLLRRVTEGSTTETKFDRHALKTLGTKHYKPAIRNEYLYRGDFLIPGKASSSLKIENPAP